MLQVIITTDFVVSTHYKTIYTHSQRIREGNINVLLKCLLISLNDPDIDTRCSNTSEPERKYIGHSGEIAA